jgi:hypothetical protein
MAKNTKVVEEPVEEGRPKPKMIKRELPPPNNRKLDNDRNAKRMISDPELLVLKFMDTELKADPERENLEVTEISMGLGVRDTDEVLRSLYTLEGKHLVEPCPPGDFTSSFWRVTPIGERAVQMFENTPKN